jgi:ATP-dependent Clp protease adaptor protein ClpS
MNSMTAIDPRSAIAAAKNAKEGSSTNPSKTKSPKAASRKGEEKKATNKPRRKRLPKFNVILLDDDDHTYAYVIEMLGQLFAYSSQRAYKMATEVDNNGRVIVMTTHKELAELKRDQIHAFGRDPRMDYSAGSMSAFIEPAK